jgi:riboflavin biosynthesis pyrimidine reductase
MMDPDGTDRASRPRLLGDFLGAGCLDEQFLTLAPQLAGRDETVDRPGLVAGRLFATATPLWATLVSVKRAGSHLFLAIHSWNGHELR